MKKGTKQLITTASFLLTLGAVSLQAELSSFNPYVRCDPELIPTLDVRRQLTITKAGDRVRLEEGPGSPAVLACKGNSGQAVATEHINSDTLDRYPFLALLYSVPSPQISDTSKVRQWPGILTCSGFFLNNEWLLTAGHCQVGCRDQALQMCDNLASCNSPYGPYFTIEAYRHPCFSNKNYNYDIALIRMTENSTPIGIESSKNNEPGELTRFPALPTGDTITSPRVGTRVDSFGWRLRDCSDTPCSIEPQCTTLIRNQLAIKPRRKCVDYFRGMSWVVPEQSVCTAGWPSPDSPCYGQSGGPLLLSNDSNEEPDVAVGIVSHGGNCESQLRRKEDYAIFSSIAPASAWIQCVTGTGLDQDGFLRRPLSDPEKERICQRAQEIIETQC